MFRQSLNILNKQPRFSEVCEKVWNEEQRWYDDTVLLASELSANPNGTLYVPSMGNVELTQWSRNQLALILGIRWNKWFEQVSGEEAANEINRRLSRMDKEWKLRIREPEVANNDTSGILGALVSPTYAPISNTRVLNALASNLGANKLDRMCVWQNHLTDRATHLSLINKRPQIIGTGSRTETYFVGFHVRNSQVGYTALTVSVYFMRLACTNGLLVSDGNFRLLYRTHRKIQDHKLLALMQTAFSNLQLMWQQGLSFLEASQVQEIASPENTVKAILRKVSGLSGYHKQVIAELNRQNLAPSKWDLIQALTHVARGIEPDNRFEMERLAGNLLTSK